MPITSLLMAASFALTSPQFSPDTVLVTLGQASITVADVDAAASQLPEEVRAGVFDSPQRIGNLLQTLVVRRAIVDDILNGQGTSGYDLEAQRQRQSSAVLIRMQLEKEMAALPRPNMEAQALAVYEQRKDQFTVPERLTVRHVLISTNERSPAEANALATDVLARIQAGSLTMLEAVQQYSEDPASATNKGIYTEFGRGKMVPAFETAAFALKNPGDLTEPVRTSFGYHIIELLERHPAGPKTFAEVAPQIHANLLRDFLKNRESTVRRALGADADEKLLARARQADLANSPAFQTRLRLAMEESALRWYRSWYAETHLNSDLEQLAREYYLTHREEFKSPVAVSVVEVFTPHREDGDDASARMDAEHLRGLANNLTGIQMLLATPPPGVRIGEQRYVEGEHEMVAARLGFALEQPGTTSDVVKVNGGYLFVALLAREPSRGLSFDEAREQIVARLRSKQELALWQAHVNEFHQLPSSANAEAIASLRTRYIDG